MGDNHRVSGLVRFIAMAMVSAGILLALPKTAQAATGLEACGNIDLSANANCQVQVQGPDCKAKCTPISFQAACAAKLEVNCRGGCNVDADVSCKASCQGGCEGDCNVDPGKFDCNAECSGSCDADCSANCQASGNQGQCVASCKASCNGSCDAKCSGTPPSATCQARCQASCNGSCHGKINADCQIDCQTPQAYASCEASVQGGCDVQCQQPSGALFCDGQFVDAGNNLQNCLDAIKNFQLKFQAQGSASVSCAASPGGAPISGGLMIMGLGAVGVGLARRRRRS